MKNDLIFQIGITLIPGIGPITTKKLIHHCGGVEAVFQEKKQLLTNNTSYWSCFSKRNYSTVGFR
jgi:5'-3' exonuclease